VRFDDSSVQTNVNNYVSPNSLIIGSSMGATLQFGLNGFSDPGLTWTNNARIRAANVTINGTATINIVNCPFATKSYPLEPLRQPARALSQRLLFLRRAGHGKRSSSISRKRTQGTQREDH